MTDLRRAIDHLGAERRGRAEWAYDEGNGDGVIYIVGSDDMRDLGRRLRVGQGDAYSLWCAATCARREVRP